MISTQLSGRTKHCCCRKPNVICALIGTVLVTGACFGLLCYKVISPDLTIFLWLLSLVLLSPLRAYLIARTRRRQHVRGLLRLVATQLVQDMTERQLAEQEVELMIELSSHHANRGADTEYISSLPHVNAMTVSYCCICLDDVAKGQLLTVLPCTHMFHSSCVDMWLEQRALCPLCKSSVVYDMETDNSFENPS